MLLGAADVKNTFYFFIFLAYLKLSFGTFGTVALTFISLSSELKKNFSMFPSEPLTHCI